MCIHQRRTTYTVETLDGKEREVEEHSIPGAMTRVTGGVVRVECHRCGEVSSA